MLQGELFKLLEGIAEAAYTTIVTCVFTSGTNGLLHEISRRKQF